MVHAAADQGLARGLFFRSENGRIHGVAKTRNDSPVRTLLFSRGMGRTEGPVRSGRHAGYPHLLAPLAVTLADFPIPDLARLLAANGRVLLPRSEERRVGKECRSRWS